MGAQGVMGDVAHKDFEQPFKSSERGSLTPRPHQRATVDGVKAEGAMQPEAYRSSWNDFIASFYDPHKALQAAEPYPPLLETLCNYNHLC